MPHIATNATNYDTTVRKSMHDAASQNLQDVDIANTNQNDLQQINDIKDINEIETTQQDKPDTKNAQSRNRITYGLKVIELMSDKEYQAFLWATQDLSESEKILMAQSLYRFTAFYQGKKDNTQNQEIDIDKQNAHRAFGVEQSMIENFIQRYKNAYEKLSHSYTES